jgi:hypothetical protein
MVTSLVVTSLGAAFADVFGSLGSGRLCSKAERTKTEPPCCVRVARVRQFIRKALKLLVAPYNGLQHESGVKADMEYAPWQAAVTVL